MELLLQCRTEMVALLGTLKYLPDSCKLQAIDWINVTDRDDHLLPQRETVVVPPAPSLEAIPSTLAAPKIIALTQNIWQQSDAAKVRTKRLG